LPYPPFGLPISEFGWSSSPFDSELYQVLKTSILKGRAFPMARLWRLVEKCLIDALTDIRSEVLREPESRPDAIVEAHLKGWAQRLKLTFE
jgi:hypothetical protein